MREPEDDAEFVAFVEGRWRRLVYAGVLLGCSQHEAEDLAQATLMKCLASWSRVRSAGNTEAYVWAMLVNELRASRRRRWWGERPTHPLPDQTQDDETHSVDRSDAVERALGRLTQAQREVVVLRFWSHLSERETAEVLEVAVGTVKSRLSRALGRLATDADILELTGSHGHE